MIPPVFRCVLVIELLSVGHFTDSKVHRSQVDFNGFLLGFQMYAMIP